MKCTKVGMMPKELMYCVIELLGSDPFWWLARKQAGLVMINED